MKRGDQYSERIRITKHNVPNTMVQRSKSLDCKFRWAEINSGFIKGSAKQSQYLKKLLGSLMIQTIICRWWKRKAAATDTTQPSTNTSRNRAGYVRQTGDLCPAAVKFACSLQTQYRFCVAGMANSGTRERLTVSQCNPMPLTAESLIGFDLFLSASQVWEFTNR